MDAEKLIPVGNITPVRFLGGTIKKGKKVNMHVEWDPEMFLPVVTVVSVPAEEALKYINTNYRKVVVHLE